MLRRILIAALLAHAAAWAGHPAAAQQLPADGGGVVGSREQPVRAEGPRGQHEYLARLRCPSGAAPAFERVGSMEKGEDGHILDGYAVQCAGAEPVTVVMDMYHPGHREMRAVPGFTVLPEIPARVAPGCPPQVVPDPDSAARYVFSHLEVERPVRLSRPFDANAPVEVGLAGRAYVEFVVDTLGQPEPATLTVRYLSDERLRPHLAAAVGRIPFAPAEHRPGCRVRQRVAGPLEFR